MNVNNVILMEFADENINYNIIYELVENLVEPLSFDLMERRERRKRSRNEHFYESTIPRFNNNLFKEHFGMSRQTLQELSNILGQRIAHTQDVIDFNKKLLFTIWTLSKPESFLAVGDRFGIAKSTGHGIFKNIVAAIAGLLPDYVLFPNEHQCTISANHFLNKSQGFPGVVGAIDSCHISIKQPVDNAYDYYNRKGFHSIILQGTCDHQGKFIDVFIGLPGRMHDARVFRNSPLYQRLTDPNDPLLSASCHLVGDSAYPLMKNLMCPYKDRHLNNRQIQFNQKLTQIRSIIERTFGVLMWKFRRLQYLDLSDMELANNITAAACVLYNFLVIHNEIDINEEQQENKYENFEYVIGEHEVILNAAEIKRNHIAELI